MLQNISLQFRNYNLITMCSASNCGNWNTCYGMYWYKVISIMSTFYTYPKRRILRCILEPLELNNKEYHFKRKNRANGKCIILSKVCFILRNIRTYRSQLVIKNLFREIGNYAFALEIYFQLSLFAHSYKFYKHHPNQPTITTT